MMPNGWDAVAVVTIALFLAGVIYDAGQKAARLEALEKWREEMRTDVHDIKVDVAKLLDRRSVARDAPAILG